VALACDMLRVHRVRYRRLIAHSGAIMASSASARHPAGAGRAARTRVDTDFGRGPDGPHRADACQLLAAQAAMDDCDPLSYPIDPLEFAVPEMRDLGSLRSLTTEAFRHLSGRQPIRQVFRDKIKSDAASVPLVRRVTLDSPKRTLFRR